MRIAVGTSSHSRLLTVMIASTVGIALAYAAVAARVSSLIVYDPAVGFLVWRSMESGAPFNRFRTAAHNDLTRYEERFESAYSPGQYLVPGFLTRLGFSLRTAIWLTTVVSSAAGLFGYFLLFRSVFGFARWVAALSCLILSLSRTFGAAFFVYTGGALLEFCVLPYMIIGAFFCLKRQTSWRLVLPLIFLAAAFFKLSIAIMALSLCLASVFIDLRDPNRSRGSRILRAAAAIAAFALFYAVLYAAYTSKGWTATSSHASSGGMLSTALYVVLLNVASLTSAVIPVLTPASRLAALAKSAGAPLPYPIFLAGIALATVLLIAWVIRKRFGDRYTVLLLAASVTYVASMTYLYTFGGVQPASRYFWPIGVLLLPGMIEGLSAVRRNVQATAILVGVLTCTLGVATARRSAFQALHAVRIGDFSYGREEKGIAAVIGAMEAQSADYAPVVFTNQPLIALLVKKSRLAIAFGTQFDSTPYGGAVSSLVVILETREVLRKTAPRIVAMFPGMSNWKTAVVGSYTILVAGQTTPPPSLAVILQPL